MPTNTTGIATEFIQFTRTSNATVTDSDGLIKWAPHNLLTNSESFDAAVWSKYLATVSANTQSAPNGTTTADTVTASAGNDVHRVQRSGDVTIGAAANASLSIFVKAGTHNFVTIGFYSASEVFVSATFNLASGSAATETDVGTTSGTIVSTEKVGVGTGWYRLTITGNYSGSSALSFVNFAQAATGNSYTNFGQPVANLVGTETFYLWGAALYRSDLGGMQQNTSAYPLYNPTTPKNLVGYTESLTTGWTNSNTTDAIVSEINPVGLTGAVDVAATAGNGTLLSSLSLLASPYTFSIWLKRKTGGGTVEITVDGTTYVAAAVTSTWTRFSTTLTPTAGTKTPGIRLVTSGDAVYAWGAQLSDSASLDTYAPVYGAAVTSAAYYGPRRDFNASTLACNGLLVEEQRTNLLLNSATLSTQNVTVTAAAHTLTFYGTGTITLSGTSTAGPLVGTGVNNRVSLTFTPTAGTLTLTVTGSVTQAQIELGSFATSYIPTGSATVTRTSDVASVSTQAFPYSATEGTIVVAWQLAQLSGSPAAIHLTDTAESNRIRINAYLVGVNRSTITAAGALVANIDTSTAATGITKYALGGKSADYAVYRDGSAGGTSTNAGFPSGCTEMRIGRDAATGNFNGHIRQITYLPRRISNAELQTRTA